MASVLTMTPPVSAARRSARADLPLAVGPAINTALPRPSRDFSMSVLCLIANPADPALDAKLVAAIQHETGGEINWLHQRVACEIIAPTAADPVPMARALVTGRPVDVALVPASNRRKKVL